MAASSGRKKPTKRPATKRAATQHATTERPPTERAATRGSARGSGATAVGAESSRQTKGGTVSEPAGGKDSNSAAKRLFDLRWLIAGMFVVYGIVLTITGIFDSQAELDKAAGVRINLWTGIGMFVVGVVFAAWARWRPLRRE